MQARPIAQISRTVRDIAAATHSYGEVLGLPHLYTFGELAFFDCGGARLHLLESAAAVADSILHFRVVDIRTAPADLVERDVSFVVAPRLVHRHDDGTEERLAAFQDHDGRPLAIMARVAAT